MEGRGFGFVTFEDPENAQAFLEVRWNEDFGLLFLLALASHSCAPHSSGHC